MSLKERAVSANREKIDEHRAREKRLREEGLQRMEEEWESTWERMRLGGEAPPFPGVKWATVATDSTRNTEAFGWRFAIDDVDFIYCVDYHYRKGILVILTCPDCGAEYATHFHGLDNLGSLLSRGRSIGHRCYERSIRELSWSIRRASDDTNLSPRAITERALETL